jgi:cysteine desulfurase/selenocysteine lyase
MIAESLTPAGADVDPLDVDAVRRDFPILGQKVHGKPLVYLDNAASTQKPETVLETMDTWMRTCYANVHRGIYQMAERTTAAYEGVRETVRRFLGAERADEIVFTAGTTEAINLVARSWGRPHLSTGDRILITEMEHHADIVPWQMVCAQTGARLDVAPIDDDGVLLLDELEKRLTPSTRMVALAHVSNVLGTVNPVREVVEMARKMDARVLVDGAQAVQHLPVDLRELGCDFYAFSGHKAYGPTGVGVLWGRYELLESMPPWQGGGDMIRSVTFEKTDYAAPPHRFEAGTPHIVGVLGLGAALDYLTGLGLEAVHAHEAELLAYATERIGELDRVRIVGNAPDKAGVLALDIEGVHPHDVATVLDRDGICVRAGHHCAQPLMHRLHLAATSRAAFGVYNTRDEVDALVAGLKRVCEVFGV